MMTTDIKEPELQAVFLHGMHKGKPRCQTWKRGDEWSFRKHQCDHVAKYADDTYCGRHDPDRLAARLAARGPTVWEKEKAVRDQAAAELAELVAAARQTVGHCPSDLTQRLRKALEAYK